MKRDLVVAQINIHRKNTTKSIKAALSINFLLAFLVPQRHVNIKPSGMANFIAAIFVNPSLII
jgi:hypothetical protein